jgi:hypothetical protein
VASGSGGQCAILQGRKHVAGSLARTPALEIEARVAEAARTASPASNRQGWRALHQPKASGHGASTDSPAASPSDYDAALRAAIERVVISRTTIEIELAFAPPSSKRRSTVDCPAALGSSG